MDARVKQDAKWATVTACAGREYTKSEWRPVPGGLEREAENNPFLEVSKEVVEPEPVTEPPATEPVDEPEIVDAPPAVEPEPAPEPITETYTDVAPVAELKAPKPSKRKG